MNYHSSSIRSTGFSLIEVVIALAVATFCLITLFGLLPVGLNTSQNASEQTVAANIVTAISADLHGSPMVGGTATRFGIVIPAAGSATNPIQTVYFSTDGNATGTVGSNAVASGTPSRYRATITLNAAATTPALSPLTKLFNVEILVTWPALADPKPATAPSNFAGSYEALTTLNCN